MPVEAYQKRISRAFSEIPNHPHPLFEILIQARRQMQKRPAFQNTGLYTFTKGENQSKSAPKASNLPRKSA